MAATTHIESDGVSQGEGSTATGIGALPAELLLEIFRHCVAYESLSVLILHNVSWWWRDLIETSPSLWKVIALRDSAHMVADRRAAIWAERCKAPNYDVELNIGDPDNILPLLSPLLQSIDRWKKLRLRGKQDAEIAVDELGLTSDTLTHLHLCLYDYEQSDVEDDPKITFSSISPEGDPNYALSLWVTRVPSPKTFVPLRFVHVTIAEGGITGLHTQPKYILEFLSACPELESFFFCGWHHDGRITRPLPVVSLPNLVTLHLKSTCFARALLSSIHAPNLQNLFLSHLNVNFQLHTEPYEVGDSEDEAGDYSQSPWSDQATGMGLRKLIHRSNPPIRVLEMDFCDMRTKDFRYVFDRLTQLEDFHIVASDMSDKVMDMLRPIVPPADSEDRTVRLRLPLLRKLRLTNCQRLSGQAIVNALTARVRWTDREFPAWTLVDVTISGCDGFSLLDRAELSLSLGNRLRL
ncbi:hypothetical protein D9613_005845 [Agrocybe pediades]|uniref:F-box domain-containing protein n=1 Tax=Agrocybe pediades TaxID=84607 RepID=A0A8H4VP88_9AGAR|nr:hypothetical protein D9613_005845 [Agrocybe pediades]